ncbi:ATP-dependent Zn protease [Leptolyngbya sp. AN02str]|uniref:ATP-dependent Zn protease n=1 Tax=Leptolyngbya sp. AN02str TaxID=3423363 RepID=UPI003D30FFAE
MNQVSFNLLAISIFTVVMATLLGPLIHLSPVVPALAVAGAMTLAAFDTLGWQNRGSTLLLDAIARFSPEHRDRVLHHEAGHFFVAHMLGIPITGYTLSAWEAFRQQQFGAGGVSFDTSKLEAEVSTGQIAAQRVDQYCQVWMAGIAAEQLVYGNAEGGEGDRDQIRLLWTALKRPLAEAELKQRWAALQAKTLLETNRDRYEALVEQMRQKAPVEACKAVLDQSVQVS